MISFLSTEHSSCTFHPTIAAVKWTAITADNSTTKHPANLSICGVFHHISAILLIPERINGMEIRGFY